MYRPADKDFQVELAKISAAVLKAAASPEFRAAVNQFKEAAKVLVKSMEQFGKELNKALDWPPQPTDPNSTHHKICLTPNTCKGQHMWRSSDEDKWFWCNIETEEE
jgi:hypothetical protein